MKKLLILLVLTLTLVYACKGRKTEHLETFAKAYGYVKYFHPSDEAFALDWQKFSAYGAKEIMKCGTKKELLTTLNSLFNPIAPSVKFTSSPEPSGNDMNTLIPQDTSGYRLIYWQHSGLSFDINSPIKNIRNIYHSTRVNRTPSDTSLFEMRPEFEKILLKEIGEGIYCHIPMVLYSRKSTYPYADSASIKQLRENLRKFDYNTEELSMRLGNVIMVYNVFQHFYPYFDVVDVNWEKEFKKALSKTLDDKTPINHLQTLQRFTAPLKDGHINVSYNKSPYYYPPIEWEWIENKLVITRIYEDSPNLHIGDIVTKINGITPEAYFKELYQLISAGTKGWLNYKANFLSLFGEKDSKLKLEVNDKMVELTRRKYSYEYYNADKNKKPRYKIISDGIWYLNMEQIELDTINKLMPLLEKSGTIICDARGYPKGNHDLITHFLNMDDTTSGWMKIPQVIYPDYKNVTYVNHNWIPEMKTKKPYLGDKKIIYIVDGRAISYAESCLRYIEGYKLARIVGQPSAGTNGNINPFTLPGGYSISWTGMKVVKHNGSQHHGIGILPDIYVEKTIDGIKEGRDEFLEKAIEIASE